MHAPASYGRIFALGISLNMIYVLVEAGYGLSVGSLALLTDAAHNLGDVLGLALAWIAYLLAKIPPSPRRTYGWRGSTILAALTNGLLLLATTGGIAWEAIGRFHEPTAPDGLTVAVVAAIGVVINTATALLFMSGGKHDLNLRGAFLHMAADAAVSAGVVSAGIWIYFTGWNWIDPATSLAVAFLIFIGTWGLLRDSVNLAIQAVPASINPSEVYDYLASLPGITEVHDLHIWAMSTTEISLTAHLVKPEVEDDDPLLTTLRQELYRRFGVGHVTLQIERDSTLRCEQASAECV